MLVEETLLRIETDVVIWLATTNKVAGATIRYLGRDVVGGSSSHKWLPNCPWFCVLMRHGWLRYFWGGCASSRDRHIAVLFTGREVTPVISLAHPPIQSPHSDLLHSSGELMCWNT
ncbi:hypothetical protein CEP54_013910 [Fusarium duplospermum]|uniref:Uncharacterized protein n=1 Tax=Fusarium duplospermum TaxID=1325734 RepID=A0A428P045_9HYPO|nr:hypothetical protein CEP54_013910 [Fusarium duplospermum]